MLRCPPSRINLTNTDIIDFEARCNARQSARLYARQRGNVRLSPGPDHYIASAVTTREENLGRASTPLQATVCSGLEDDDSSGVSGVYGSCGSEIDAGIGSSDVQDLDESQISIRTETVQVFEPLSQRILSPRKAEKRPDFGDSPVIPRRETSSPVNHAAGPPLEGADAVLDGAIDSRPSVVRPSPRPRKGLDASDRSILGEINSDAYPSSNKPLTQLPPTPPALASARARRRHTRSHGPAVHQDAHPPVELNPDAPAFIPQTRLARNDRSSSGSHSVVFLALEPRWNSLDSTRSTSSLRIRSSSEQNIELETSQRAAAEHRHSRPLPPRPARRRLSNEHPLRPSPHLERYPLLRPPPRPQPPPSRQQRRRSSRVQTRPPTPSARRVPSIVSAASGISSSLSSRRTSMDGLLDASAEFLRMRSSPLDELTERISRVAASRQRSVGRSWERMMPVGGGRRVELLSGELFLRREGVAVAAGEQGAGAAVVARTQVTGASEDAGTHQALPSASPPRALTSSVPSTPLNASGASSAPSPLAQKSPSKAVEGSSSAVKRKPLLSEIATPRLPVYDDSKPPGTQPRTPADIPHVSRPRRQPSDTLTAMSPLTVATHIPAMGSPAFSSIPDRPAHRSAHSSTTPRPRRPHAASAPRASHEENDLEGQVSRHPELEEDRRTWFSRKEDGSLESTPPREGRFEQFLS